MAFARQQFKVKHASNPDLVAEAAAWDDLTFLHKVRVAFDGKIKRAGVVLLGRAESVQFITPSVARVTWILKNPEGTELDYAHFDPPFILNVNEVFKNVRNLTLRTLSDLSLFPKEITKYDDWVFREALHNCIAHQDYTLHGRIYLVEQDDSLLFTNLGSFIPGTVENVIKRDAPEETYRNPCLAQAMVALNMIDSIGSGILRMFRKQSERFLPRPDYDLADPRRVKVRIIPVVAAVDDGPTRAVLAAKYEFATFGNSAVANTEQFYLNLMNWLAQGEGTAATIVTDLSAARNWLNARGYANVTLTSNWENALGTADVLVTYMDNPSAAKQTAAINFLAAGGNLFAGANGWSSPTPGGNVVLRTLGLSWSGDYSDSFDGTILRATPAANAVLGPDVIANTGNYTTAQQVEAAVAVRTVGRVVPDTDPLFAAVRASILANASTLVPSPASPVTSAVNRTKLNIEAAVLNSVPVNQLFAHRTAPTFGVIPAGAPRVTATKTFAVSPANAAEQWLSTGLYAAPGEVVTVTVPAALVNAGWTVKVSSHTDDIYRAVTESHSYRRMPTAISRDFAITANTVSVGSVFGGLLYLVKPQTTGTANHAVTFANAVEAPTFVLGTTTDAAWVAGLRDLPAPYAELVGSNIIITLHSSDIRNLSNPTSVLQYWDAAVAVQDHLGNSLNPRTYPERINDDLQISAGWMHSGYPVMAYANNLANMVDSDPADDWGFFHEFGHNHQSDLWTFDSEGEVTVNIFSMRAYDAINGFGNTVPGDDWAEMWTDAGRSSHIPGFIAGGRARNDNSAGLVTYAQLRQSFGWGPFETFFRQYLTAAPASTLQVFGDQLTDGFGAKVDADGNGQVGGTRVVNFRRLFGDANGDAAVNFADFLAFRSAFGTVNSAFDGDGDGDGDVDFNDFLAFRARFGTSVP